MIFRSIFNHSLFISLYETIYFTRTICFHYNFFIFFVVATKLQEAT